MYKINPAVTVDEIVAKLERLNKVLPESSLRELVYFNQAYLIITQNIASNNSFKNSRQLNNLEIAFANLYFDAVNSLNSSQSPPKSWKKIGKTLLGSRPPSSLSLMLGANAHINTDMPQALQTTIKFPNDIKHDYFKINSVLLGCCFEISKSYNENSESLNFLKKRLRLLYIFPVMGIVLFWRLRVWLKFEQNRGRHVESSI